MAQHAPVWPSKAYRVGGTLRCDVTAGAEEEVGTIASRAASASLLSSPSQARALRASTTCGGV